MDETKKRDYIRVHASPSEENLTQRVEWIIQSMRKSVISEKKQYDGILLALAEMKTPANQNIFCSIGNAV